MFNNENSIQSTTCTFTRIHFDNEKEKNICDPQNCFFRNRHVQKTERKVDLLKKIGDDEIAQIADVSLRSGQSAVRPSEDRACASCAEDPLSSFGKIYRARCRLFRSQLLQENMRLKALAEIYTMHSSAQLCNLIFL